jgi:hypothetical protein
VIFVDSVISCACYLGMAIVRSVIAGVVVVVWEKTILPLRKGYFGGIVFQSESLAGDVREYRRMYFEFLQSHHRCPHNPSPMILVMMNGWMLLVQSVWMNDCVSGAYWEKALDLERSRGRANSAHSSTVAGSSRFLLPFRRDLPKRKL